jgi:cation diffusion facilitator CzcD-associated flavoprotein CzcO
LESPDFDILIIGAGLSGIGIACRLSQRFPEQRIGILERRESIGGTWDLFRYPGIRSDSDMFTYAFDLRPWRRPEILASGGNILDYLAATIEEFGIRDKIQFGQQVESADWRCGEAAWHLDIVDTESNERRHVTTRFLVACTGYYDQDVGYMPRFPGSESFAGTIVHPQHWPEELDYRDKNVVVIGSGATAATIVPAMAGTTRHITMLQRSPSYYYPVPARDPVFIATNWLLPARLAARAARMRSHGLQYLLFNACRRWPGKMRRFLLRHVRREIGPEVDMKHFAPRYAPWDERLCILPEDDLLRAFRSGDASVVTGQIDTFTRDGIRLESGEELRADIIVAATGLNLKVFGGIRLSLDGDVCQPSELMTYKGLLVEGLPNFAVVFGYINFTWTAKVDLVGKYLCRLFEHLAESGLRVVTPRSNGATATGESIMNRLNSGYVRRGSERLLRQGDRYPWRVSHDYRRDRKMLLRDPLDDDILEFRA